MSRLLIAGTRSGSGKTTVTCALLAALRRRGHRVAAFKCGPDYIDPLFHRAMGVGSYNLDPYFLGKDTLRAHFAAHAEDINIIEGVMGFYDGIAGTSEGSTATVARWLEAPVVYAEGLLPYDERLSIPSRHLGLATEFAQRKDLSRHFADAGEQLDVDGLLKLAASAPKIEAAEKLGTPPSSVRLAVARDEAFCFLYEENLELLQSLGCELVFFSPLHDKALPPGIHGLYLCGGYPELHSEKLSENLPMLSCVRYIVQQGLPTIAECGGFLYLHTVGVVKGEIWKREKLGRFGYIEITAKQDNLLCRAGESIRSHEFHYYDSTNPGVDFQAVKPIRGTSWDCVHASETLYAGFPHLYFPAKPAFAKRFVERMKQVEPT